MSSPPKDSVPERKQAIHVAWFSAWRTILPARIDLLHIHLLSFWIDSPELFNITFEMSSFLNKELFNDIDMPIDTNLVRELASLKEG